VVPRVNSLALLSTNYQIYDEAEDVWAKRVLFNFENGVSMMDKLSALHPATLSKIRDVIAIPPGYLSGQASASISTIIQVKQLERIGLYDKLDENEAIAALEMKSRIMKVRRMTITDCRGPSKGRFATANHTSLSQPYRQLISDWRRGCGALPISCDM
jgi:hypothetical protein